MPSQLFTSYDAAGRVVSTGRAGNPLEQVPETGGVFVGAQFDGDAFWFPGGVPTPRPDAPALALSATTVVADGAAAIVLTGVPAGARVDFGGLTAEADGEPIALSTNVVGPNKIGVDAFPARRWEGWFNGTAP